MSHDETSSVLRQGGQARTDIEAACVVCGDLLVRTRHNMPYHPGCKDRYDALTSHETQYGVTATKRDGVTTTFTNPQWQDHRPLKPAVTFIEKTVPEVRTGGRFM